MAPVWYTKTSKDIFYFLHSNENGITLEESRNRLQKYGLNKLPEAKVDSLALIFLRQFQSPLIYILFIASLIVFALGEFIDGFIILFVIIFNAVVGAIQEGKAQNTLLALKNFAETKATVLRDGIQILIPDYEVVPGDIIILQEGAKVPADARIIISNNLTVDEAALTGESLPAQKQVDALEQKDLPTAEQRNMVFKGTHIVAGSGQAVVVATGLNTVLGKISKAVALINVEIPLKANIRYLSRLIIITVLCICFSLFFLGILLGHSVKEMFTTVVSLAVSIIPEGLPIVMTLVLATGVWRMSKRHALVKKLMAVESLGQTTIIAVDKTGTITKNEISLQKVYVNGRSFEVTASGYEPAGNFSLQGKKINPNNFSELDLAGKIAIYGTNAEAYFDEDNKEWKAAGDPTEVALSVFSRKLGFQRQILEKQSRKLSEIPFDYKNKFYAATHEVKQKAFLTVVGAPEVILKLCRNIWQDGKHVPFQKEKIMEYEKIFIKMSEEGLRVLAFAIKDAAGGSIDQIHTLTFVGFFGLKDGLRPEVHEAMTKALDAGIKVVMITGDHKITARAIATEAGIYKSGDIILTGEELDQLSDEELIRKIKKVSVFARVEPQHKLRIVQAYKKNGEIVAMTGDGVNDAPSLVAADLGVSMGKIGTEVAKEASDIVLLDDNFGSIITAVEEGRNIYKTIKKVILYLFSTSFGEVFAITGALILGFPLPILAAQIIWLNLVTDGFLDVSLAMEPKEEGLLKGSYEHPKKYLLDALAIKRMFLMAVTMMAGTLFLFQFFIGPDMTKAWTVSLTTLAVFQWFNAWNCRNERKSILALNPFSNKFLVGATIIVISLQLFAIYTPIMQRLLRTTPLNISEWVVIVLVASSIIWIEEARKLIHRRLTL